MKAKMTSKERVLAAMQRKEVDYVPCVPFFNFQEPSQRVGRKWEFPFGPSVIEMLDYSYNVLKIDQVINFSIPNYPDKEVISNIEVKGDVLTKEYITPAGVLRASVRLNEHWPHGYDITLMGDFNTAHFIEPWIKSKADIECLKYIFKEPTKDSDLDRLRLRYKDTRALADKYDAALYCYFGHGLTGALNMFGAENLCQMTLDDPELVHAYLEVDHQWNMRTYELALALGVDFIRRDGFYETCDFFSPKMLTEFLGKRLKDEVDLVHSAGKPIGYTVLSGFGNMLDHLLAVGFDCIMCPDVFLRDGDAKRLKDKLGDKTSFFTGPSDTIHMPWDDTKKVREAIRYIFEIFDKTGLLITPCSSAKAVYPWDNVLAMIDEWRRLIQQT